MRRSMGEQIEDVCLTVGHDRHPRSTFDLSSGVGVGAGAAARALTILRRPAPTAGLTTGLATFDALQKLQVHRDMNGPVARIHRDHRMQMFFATARGPRHRGVLDRRHIPARRGGLRARGLI